MSIIEVVVFTTILAFCVLVAYRAGYRKGYKDGAAVVLKSWNDWLNEVEEMEK